MTKEITKGIKVSVNSVFCGVQERNYQKHYLFDYYITIENLSPNTVQLSSRYWEIHDSLNYTEIVEGDGVIGLQPVLKQGEKHAYKSHCILLSNCGSMRGYYNMIDLDKKVTFKAIIPQFQLQTEAILN